MIGLITTDVGNTLGVFPKPSVNDLLYELSGIPAVEGRAWIVGEEERRFLHTVPELTSKVVSDICNALLIDRRAWLDPWPRGAFTSYPYANAVLAELRRIAPIAALSNIPILDDTRMADLAQQCGEYIEDIYTSCAMRRRKPDPTLWLDIATAYRVRVGDVVHIGDRWVNDVCGAVAAGARAVYLASTRHDHRPIPPYDDIADHVAIVGDLRDVPAVLRAWSQI